MCEFSDDSAGRLYTLEVVSERAVSRCQQGLQHQDSGRVPGAVHRQPALCRRRLGH